mmetsp:Transcript_23277/g.53863  ORF Transcript_23277/g.53863 Transcript_23277/m.53863 type:complete len:186 (-) Transcript_23277:25-582(-)
MACGELHEGKRRVEAADTRRRGRRLRLGRLLRLGRGPPRIRAASAAVGRVGHAQIVESALDRSRRLILPPATPGPASPASATRSARSSIAAPLAIGAFTAAAPAASATPLAAPLAALTALAAWAIAARAIATRAIALAIALAIVTFSPLWAFTRLRARTWPLTRHLHPNLALAVVATIAVCLLAT